MDALISADRAKRGLVPRDVSDDEIRDRCLYAMVNEAAKILDEGIAARPVDVDAIWLHGYGFPAHRGGLLFWADQVGLPVIAKAIDGYHARFGGSHWELSPLLRRLAQEGRGFRDL